MENDIISFGDFIILISSFPFEKRGITNLMLVESIGEILVRGFKGIGKKIKGKVAKIISVNGDTSAKAKDKIIVISKCDERYLEAIKSAKGIILQNSFKDTFSETFLLQAAERLGIPIIVRAKYAFDILDDDEEIVLDPDKALIYIPEKN